jgi:hypothetical protein
MARIQPSSALASRRTVNLQNNLRKSDTIVKKPAEGLAERRRGWV